MNKTFLLTAIQAVAFACATTVFAADEDADSEKAEETSDVSEATDFGHGGQFSLRAGLIAGYRIVFRYDDSHFCVNPAEDEAEDPRQLCGFGAPMGLDLALGFAPLDVVEPFVWMRLGLGAEDQTDTEALRAVGAGVRLYSRSEESLKIFVEPAFAFEFEGSQGTPVYQTNQPNYNTDLMLHVAAGPQYDITENVGVYLGAGLTTGIFRAIHTTMELQFGAQGRL